MVAAAAVGRRRVLSCLAALVVAAFAGRPANAASRRTAQASWSVTQRGSVLEIAYGAGVDFPQYGALHLESGYFRLNYGPGSGWGTSLVLPPAFWSGGHNYQGTPLSATWQVEGADLVLSIAGTIASLSFFATVTISPPAMNAISARVAARVEGTVPLDARPGESYKPILLSSMHISPGVWDTQAAFADSPSLPSRIPLPASGWIVQPPVAGYRLGLLGGTSTWKQNAPTIDVTFVPPAPPGGLQVTGWVTPSNDPNDDNVAYWLASDQLVPAWSYLIRVTPLRQHLPSAHRNVPA